MKPQVLSYRGKKHEYYLCKLGRPRFQEVDSYGVVWNGHYVSYFETGRLALCRHFGFDMELLAAHGVFLPVYKYEVTITKAVLPSDEITIAVRAAELSESRMVFQHLLLAGEEIRASCEVQHVAMSRETGSIAFVLPEQVKVLLRPIREAFTL